MTSSTSPAATTLSTYLFVTNLVITNLVITNLVITTLVITYQRPGRIQSTGLDRLSSITAKPRRAHPHPPPIPFQPLGATLLAMRAPPPRQPPFSCPSPAGQGGTWVCGGEGGRRGEALQELEENRVDLRRGGERGGRISMGR